MENVIIIGSGPAGLTAAIYCARASLQPAVVAGLQPGGQLTTTSVIENFPGFAQGVDGTALMDQMRQQAEHVGARFLDGTVTQLHQVGPKEFRITLDAETQVYTKAVIVATGASAITLDLPNKARLMGYGLSTCAVCDGFFYRQKKVAVVGGGDSAMEEAHYLAKLASEVTLIHRRDKFRASKAMQDKVLNHPKIKVIWNTEVVDTTANDSGLTGVITQNLITGSRDTLAVDGLFMAIGHTPNTSFLKGVVEMDQAGYLTTHNGTFTSTPGIFAAGDVEDKLYRQAITAAGRGCQAALQCEKWLEGLSH
jgi:thioredoxin reductase (NADPH)